MNFLEVIVAICSFITGIAAASAVVSKVVTKAVEKMLEPTNKKLDELDRTQCQNYLIEFLTDVEKGVEKDSSQWEHAHKTYDHYTKDLNGNSYIHTKWEKVVEKK